MIDFDLTLTKYLNSGVKMNPKSKHEKVVKQIRRMTRKKYSSEEKIRIILDGLRA